MKIEKLVISVGGLTLISRIFGYVRDIAIAFYLGASIYNDAFIIALRLPNMFRSIFAEGALNNVFVPIFSAKLKKDGILKAQAFASNIQILLIIALVVFSAFMMFNMKYVISVLAQGYIDNTQLITFATNLGLISFPYIIFISLTAFYGGMSNSLGNFLPFATAPIILNIMLIAFIFFGNTAIEKTYWLTISLPLAGIVEMLWVMYFVYKKIGPIKLKAPTINVDTKVFFKRFTASIIGSGMTQINLVISTMIGSFTINGISYLYYADRVYQLPLALIGTALGVVILPELSKKYAKDQINKFQLIKHRASIFVLYATLPSVIIINVLAEEIITVLFQYGAFTAVATHHTATVLKIFALGLPAYCYLKIFSSSFYAIGDAKTPVKIAIISLIINVGISLILLFKFQHVAVAIASVTTSYISMFIMAYILYKKGLYKIYKQSILIKLKILFSSAIMLVTLIIAKHMIVLELPIISLIIYLSISSILYLILTHVLKVYDLTIFLKIKKS